MLLPLVLAVAVAQQPARARPSPPARPSAGRAVSTAPEGAVIVAAAGRESRVLLMEERQPGRIGRWVRADQLAAAGGGSLVEEGIGRWRLRLPGVTLLVREGVPFVGSVEGEGVELPLAAAPQVEGERLWLPFQLVSDVLPRVTTGVQFDATRRALSFVRAAAPPARRPASASRTTEERAAPAPDSATAAATAAATPVSEEPPREEPTRLPTIVGPRRAPAEAPSPVPVPAERPSGGGTLARRTVVIDAGHGGPDAGMRSPRGGGAQVVEKDVTLAVSQALRAALRERGVGVAMTRTTDTLIALADRGRIATERSGDLFISIHVNAANPAWRNPRATRGFETYILSEARSADDRQVADRENESVRFERGAASDGADPLAFIMRDMAQNEHLRESSALATLVQRRLAGVHPGPNRGVRQAGFRVLVSAFMPAVLVEIGFGSNPEDAAWIGSARGQRAIADAVADAAVEYLRRLDQRVRTGSGQ